jgi:catechol 2,3-dioxygenase-like lactoylglutathione lyase family enzyme
MLKRLDNVGIAVRDIRRAVAFYTEILGFVGQADESDGLVTLGDVSPYLFQTRAPEAAAPQRTTDLYNNPPGIDHVAFEVDDIEQAARQLEAAGVFFPGPAVGEPGAFRYRGYADPDGTMLYIVQKPA